MWIIVKLSNTLPKYFKMFSSESYGKIESHVPQTDPYTWSTSSVWRTGYGQFIVVDVEPLHSFCIQSETSISKEKYLFTGAIEDESGIIDWAIPQYNTQCSYKGAISIIRTQCKQGVHVEFCIADEIEYQSRLSFHAIAEHIVVW